MTSESKVFLVATTVGIALGFLIGEKSAKRGQYLPVEPRIDTVVVVDTITAEKPVYIDRYVTEYMEVPVTDTIIRNDTTFIQLPRESKVYAEDSVYRAVVSGYEATLDSLWLYRRTVTVTKENVVPVPQTKRFGVGVQAGYGVSKDGLTPYVGVGLHYNILGFDISRKKR